MGFIDQKCTFDVLSEDLLSECDPFTCGEDDDMDDNNEPSEESVSFESALLAAKKRKINRHLGDSVFECIMMGSTKDVQEHVQYAAMESVDTMSIMDAAFMETVLKYTVLETVQTMGLYNFDHSDIKKICNHYMK